MDVAPRDGLQIECKHLPPQKRLELIHLLENAGVSAIEIGSFVNPKRVPQMAGLPEICDALDLNGPVRHTALVPNHRGFTSADASGMRHVRLALLASESLNKANFERSIDASLREFDAVAALAGDGNMAFGVIIGGAFGCPFEGDVPSGQVMTIVRHAAKMGADEIVLADTTGMAIPSQVDRVCRSLIQTLAGENSNARPGIHLHNTRNTGYANAYAAFEAGIRLFDTSLGGIGGCPFSPGALGNVATEDMVHMFNGMGVETGIDLDKLLAAAKWLSEQLEKDLPAMIGRAAPVYRQPVSSKK